DPATGRRLGRLTGHNDNVRALAFSPDGKLLASGSDDGTIVLWKPASRPDDSGPAARTREELLALWEDLASQSGMKAYRAVRALARSGDSAVTLLAERLRPVPGPDAKRIAALVADLDNDEFAAREGATQELIKLGPAARSVLRRTLAGK